MAAVKIETEKLKVAPEAILELSIQDQHSIAYAEVQTIQLAAARKRFGELVERIPMLARLAEEQGISEIRRIEDLAPLLMVHSAYKSYPLSFIENGAFDRLTRWLDGLTTHDLSGIDASQCNGIDDWILLLERDTPLRVLHSTGTTGKLSFIPRSEDEVRHSINAHLRTLEPFGEEPPALGVRPDETVIIAPAYRKGAMAIHRFLDAFETYYYRDREHIITLDPGRFSADLASLGGRLRAAEAKGELGQMRLSPKLMDQRQELSRQQEESAGRLEALLDEFARRQGQCVWFMGGTAPALFKIAEAARRRGMQHIFHPDSFATGGGGAKGQALPDDWPQTVKEVLGVSQLKPLYGMTELMVFSRICPQGHYHVPPSGVPFLLDPGSGEQFPRTGTRTGRYGVFDLNPWTYWGGYLSGDEVTLSWGDTEPCPCGRIGPYVHQAIRRYSEKEGGDDKITCAGAPEAHDKALDFLLSSLQ